MGYYINPPSVSKEAWLKQYGKPIPTPKWDEIPADSLPVCLVQNSMFSAAGIAYDEEEFNSFLYPSDKRKKEWFLVTKEMILQVESSISHLIKLPKKEQ